MRLRIADLSWESRRVVFKCSEESVNERLQLGRAESDVRFAGPIEVEAQLYRSRGDVHLGGLLKAIAKADCRRCLGECTAELSRNFDFTLVRTPRAGECLDDENLAYYDGESIDIEPLICEQALLVLNAGMLCRDDCKGLCLGCGVDLNHEVCSCVSV